MTTANEFLKYVAENEKEIKYALRKNITFDAELFDDCFQESIIKIYNSLLKNDKPVSNWKSYTFIAFKWNYVNRQNQKRRYDEQKLDIDLYRESDADQFLYSSDEEETVSVDDRLKDLRKTLKANFSERATAVYIDYKLSKYQAGISTYESIAKEHGCEQEYVSSVVRKIDNFLSVFVDKYNKINPLF